MEQPEMTANEIARRILMLEGELNFALDIRNIRQAAVLRRQIAFWRQQQDEQRHLEVDSDPA